MRYHYLLLPLMLSLSGCPAPTQPSSHLLQEGVSVSSSTSVSPAKQSTSSSEAAQPTPENTSRGTSAPQAEPGNSGTTPTKTPSLAPESVDLSKIQNIRLRFETRYFSDAGQSSPITVEALDASGQPLQLSALPLRFSSSRPQDFTVDANGKLTALVSSGYTEVQVSLEGTDLSDKQIFSVYRPGSEGGSSSSGSTGGAAQATEENVNGQIEFQF